jgi:hypothetical protein
MFQSQGKPEIDLRDNIPKSRPLRTFEVFFISMLMPVTLLFFGPGSLYYYNRLEFTFSFYEVFFGLTVITCLSSLMLFAVLQRIPGYKRVLSCVFVLAVLLWLQGNVLLWDYGHLDSADIPWEDKYVYGIIDAAIWFSLLAVALLRPESINKIAYKLGIALIFVQLVSLVLISIRTTAPSWAEYTEDGGPKFSFSSGENIIILVLDSFQTDIFQEILLEDESYGEIFDGFTYFRNAVGGYPTTYPSIPLMLTGRYYDNSVPIQEFIKESYLSCSVPGVLKKKGYHVFMPIKKSIYCGDAIASNHIRKRETIRFEPDKLIPLLDLALFKYSPHVLKAAIFDKKLNKPRVIGKIFPPEGDGKDGAAGGERKHADIRFIEEMISESRLGPYGSVFKLYHLNGLHAPYRLNERLEYEELQSDIPGATELAKAELRITGMFLDKLKEMGIYDNAMIFMVADHGSFKVEEPGWLSNNNMAYLNPLVLVKPFSSRGGIKVSEAPVSLADIPMTILEELGLNDKAPGVSMFKVDKSAERVQRYFSYSWEGDWNSAYLPDMREYSIKGPGWLHGSWRRSHRTFAPSKVIDPDNPYVFGERVTFENKENFLRYCDYGFSSNGESLVSIGEQASMTFYIGPVETGVGLVVELAPLIGSEKMKGQRVIVMVNGKKEGLWTVAKEGEYRIVVPGDHIKGSRSLNIVLELPDAVSPLEMGTGKVQQSLAVVLSGITLLSL